MAIALFLAAVAASLLDPIAWIGYLVAGIFIQSRIWSVAAGIAWRLALHALIVIPASHELQSRPSALSLAAGLVAAAIATFAVNVIAERVRRRKSDAANRDYP